MKRVVKRRGHTEDYDERKLYASVFRACTVVSMPMTEAELVAASVCRDMAGWLDDKHEITSRDIFREVGKHLEAYNSEAAYMYKHFRNVS